MVLYKGYSIPDSFDDIVELANKDIFNAGIMLPCLQIKLNDNILMNIPVTLEEINNAKHNKEEQSKILNTTLQALKAYIDQTEVYNNN